LFNPIHSTFQQNCKAYIDFKYNDEKKVLQVYTYNLQHNHQVSPSIFKHLPKQRRIAEADKDTIIEVLECEGKFSVCEETYDYNKKSGIFLGDKKILTQKIQEKTGKIILRKDLNNFAASLNKRTNGYNDIQNLILEMKNVKGATVDVGHFENEIVSVFFQDERMKKMFELYPEVMLIDATYRTNNMRMPLFVMLIVDGNGETEIAGLEIVRSESIISTSSVFKSFKKFNENHSRIEVVIADKDLRNITAVKEALPKAKIQLCMFHVLQTFRREITAEKRKMNRINCKRAIEVLTDMVYAVSEKQYFELYNELVKMDEILLMEYFNDNWHNIREMWILGLRDKHAHFFNRTNNRTEAFNGKIQSLVKKYSNIIKSFKHILYCGQYMATIRDHKAAMLSQKVSNPSFLCYLPKYITKNWEYF